MATTKTEKSNFKHYFNAAPKDLNFENNFRYEIVRSKEALMSIKANALELGQKTIAVDTETTGLDFNKDRIVGISFSFDAYSGYYIPIRHDVGQNAEEGILDLFYDELMCKDFTVLFFNAIFDMFMFILEGKEYTKVKFFDTHTLVFNADSQAPEKNLKFAAKHFLGRDPDNFLETLGGKATFDQITPEDGVYYAVSDSCNTFGLYLKLMPILSKECPLSLKLDNNLVRAMLFYMQQKVYIDKERMINLYVELDEQKKTLEQEIFDYFGYHFNLDCIAPESEIQVLYKGGLAKMSIKDYYDKYTTDQDFALWSKVNSPSGYQYVDNVISKDHKEIYHLELDGGAKLSCSANHAFLVKSIDQNNFVSYDFIKAKDLKVDMDILTQKDLVFENIDYKELVLAFKNFELSKNKA